MIQQGVQSKPNYLTMFDSASLYRVGTGKRPMDFSSAPYDVFIGAFNLSERVSATFSRIQAHQKYWLIHNEYEFSQDELPSDGPLLRSDSLQEADFIIDALDPIRSQISERSRLCIDITGFMRAHLMFLIGYLKTLGVQKFDLVYAEPSQYLKKADTVFSSDVFEVRQVNGFEGVHSVDMTKDLLVIGAGYDHDLVSHVTTNKGSARLLQMLSLPSLSADMYQESLIRLHKVADAPMPSTEEQLAYSSANDPFATYLMLGDAIRRIESRHGAYSNLYLSPLATKPQAVGFALYYLHNLANRAASIIFPFARRYSKETSTGVGRTWRYEIDLAV